MTRGLRMRLASPVTFDREDCEVAVVITRGKWELLMTICVCVCSDLQIMAPPINGIRKYIYIFKTSPWTGQENGKKLSLERPCSQKKVSHRKCRGYLYLLPSSLCRLQAQLATATAAFPCHPLVLQGQACGPGTVQGMVDVSHVSFSRW